MGKDNRPRWWTQPAQATPVTIDERVKWADARVQAAVRRCARDPQDPALQAALAARRGEAAELRAKRDRLNQRRSA